MSKKKKHKKQEDAGGAEQPLKKNSSAKTPSNNLRLHFAIIALFALVLYGNTLKNGFAFDDSVVITGNQYTKEGLKGIPDLVTHDLFSGIYGQSLELSGGRYRPLTLVTHAVEYQLWGDKHPGLDHFMNILFYAIAGWVMFITLDGLLKGGMLTAFVATLIFIAHPIHTEVVANIKSRDEILCFIFLMLTLHFLFRFITTKTKKHLGWSIACYALSLFTKEHGITFLAIIPLTLYFFSEEKGRSLVMRTLPYVGVALVYLFLRSAILHTGEIKDSTDVMENPFYGIPLGEKLATISHILGKYLLLLFIPHPLSADYSFNEIPYITWSSLDAIIPLLVYLGLGIYALATFKRKDVFSFCILFFFFSISIVSNVFFNIGAPMGERFVFLPSFAVCLALAVGIMKVMKQVETKTSLMPGKLYLPLAVILIPYSIKTITRNPDWKSNETLFAKDVQTVPNSGKAHYYYGNNLYNYYVDSLNSPRRPYLLQEAKRQTLAAVQIAPRFYHAHFNLGMIYIEEKNGDSAIYHFSKVVEIIPPSTIKENGSTKIIASEKYIQAMQNLARSWVMLKNAPDKGIEVLNTALQYGQNNASTLEYLGICYAMKGDNTNALKYYNQSLAVNPNNAQIYTNIGMMYQYAKDSVKAQEYFNKAKQFQK